MGKHISVSNYRSDPYYPRIVEATREILRTHDAVAPIDIFLSLGLLTRESVEGWRGGRIPYLKKVILCNLAKASRIQRILRSHAHDLNMEPKLGVYSRKKTPTRCVFPKQANLLWKRRTGGILPLSAVLKKSGSNTGL